MNVQEWLSGDRPQEMLKLAHRNGTARKLRLLGCACVRRVWHVIDDRYALGALGLVEEFADGDRTERSVRDAMRDRSYSWQANSYQAARVHTVALAVDEVVDLNVKGGRLLGSILRALDRARAVSDHGDERAAQAGLVRDVYGNPFRPSRLDASLPTPQVHDLARVAYAERSAPRGELDEARLGVLADALEEAGCGDAELFAHLRSPGPHVRGCWALDVVLGKE